jgi:P-type Ca2+ transporter type 2C
VKTIPATDIAAGDVLVFESGDMITADCRLIEANKLQVNESVLSGESLPVSKNTDVNKKDARLQDRTCMVYKGTSVTRGSGKGIVAAVGMDTELGRISSLVEKAEDEITPLEKRLAQLGRTLIWLTLMVVFVVGLSGFIRGRDLFLMLRSAIALAVAAVPEGLPIVATIALARGMLRMARKNALVNRLSSVETLGSTTVICTDKTGTLTENQMTVRRILLPCQDIAVEGEGLELKGDFRAQDRKIDPADHALIVQMLRTGVLCNNASLNKEKEGRVTEAVGDPVESALLIAGQKAGLKRPVLLKSFPEVREEAFDTGTRMMATYHETDQGLQVMVKGAPEAVAECVETILTSEGERKWTDRERKKWEEKNKALAEEGFRVLALARKSVKSREEKPYARLTLQGLAGFYDPPRMEMKAAIETYGKAGIRTVMVTGDQPATARFVGREVGLTADPEPEVVAGDEIQSPADLSGKQQQRLLSASLFARVTPEQKLRLIELHQKNGSVVAMTGDGVNDAPALKRADIGVAMGRRGTQVAREASDIVLKDDNFSTIGTAIRYGRIIFSNIRKFILYLLSGNMAEILIVGIVSLTAAPLPLLPFQILFLNMILDVFPALALGLGEGSENVMHQPPRDPEEQILTRAHWRSIVIFSSMMTCWVLIAYTIVLSMPDVSQAEAGTVSFLTLAFSRLWHVFNMRTPDSSWLKNEVTQNKYVWGAIVLCLLLIVSVLYISPVAGVLKVVPLSAALYGIVLGMSALTFLSGQIYCRYGLPPASGSQKPA